MAAYQLLGQSFSFFHNQLFCKPAEHGGELAWLLDYSYWTFTKPMHHLTCWIGLNDANIDNSCLYFVQGSHKWGLLPIIGLTCGMDAVREILSSEQVEAFDKRVPNELLKGYTSFHYPLMMHGSYTNTSSRPRRAVVLNAMDYQTLGNTADYERKEALKNFPDMPQDKILDSQLFPLLFEGDKELVGVGREIPIINIKEF